MKTELFGTVVIINRESRVMAILVDDGEYSVALMSEEIGFSLRDRVSGALKDCLEDIIIHNLDTGQSGTVHIDSIERDPKDAAHALEH